MLAAAEIEEHRRAGATCISETRLTLGAATARIDILCRTKIGGLMGAEVRIGDSPSFTPNQLAV